MCNLLGYAQTTYVKLGINMLAIDLPFALLSKYHMSLSEACLPLYTAPVAFLHKRVMRQHHPFIAPGGLGAKKKQGSGRSPEILLVHWPFGLKCKAYKPSC